LSFHFFIFKQPVQATPAEQDLIVSELLTHNCITSSSELDSD
jgi:hypothetical protein